jgi:hypothetical protein
MKIPHIRYIPLGILLFMCTFFLRTLSVITLEKSMVYIQYLFQIPSENLKNHAFPVLDINLFSLPSNSPFQPS